MKRRDLTLAAAAAVGIPALGLVAATSSRAQGKPPQKGSDYLVLDKRVAVEAPAGKIEVVEFFWYSCPHCNAFEPRLEAWIKTAPKDVAVRRAPVAFRDDFVPQQKLFYALEALRRVDDLHRKVFLAIHAERQPLNTDAAIVAWAEKQGLDKAKFLDAYNSFSVATKARRAAQMQNEYKVEGVPALGVAGRYYTDGSMAGSMDRALQVAEYLIGEARKGG